MSKTKSPQCRRCRAKFASRELLQVHAESQHSDFITTRTQSEYLRFLEGRGTDTALAVQIPAANFLPDSQLQQFVRAKKAVPQ